MQHDQSEGQIQTKTGMCSVICRIEAFRSAHPVLFGLVMLPAMFVLILVGTTIFYFARTRGAILNSRAIYAEWMTCQDAGYDYYFWTMEKVGAPRAHIFYCGDKKNRLYAVEPPACNTGGEEGHSTEACESYDTAKMVATK